MSHAVFFDDPQGEALVREGLTSPLYDSEDAIPDELDDVVTRMATAVHRVDYQVGTRWAERAELDLIDLHGKVRTITMEPLLRFQFKGLGYGHPQWGQGMWKGELEVGGESFDPLELDPLAPENIHVQQVVRLDDGEEITASVSSKARQVTVKLLPGDGVAVEISPYDPTRGRIKERLT